jgi:2,4-dienoyl-CoA reductase (NADPH2)
VTIIEEGKRIGRDIAIFNAMPHRRKLAELGIKQLTNVKVERIIDNGIVVTMEGKEQTIDADTIVLAAGMEANKELLEELSITEVEEIHSIGDCVAPRKAYNAIHDGFRVGVSI